MLTQYKKCEAPEVKDKRNKHQEISKEEMLHFSIYKRILEKVVQNNQQSKSQKKGNQLEGTYSLSLMSLLILLALVITAYNGGKYLERISLIKR